MKNNFLNKREIQLILVLVSIYDLGIIYDNYNVAAGLPFFLRSINSIFSPITLTYLLLPILAILFSYLTLSEIHFSSLGKWMRLRKGRQNLFMGRELLYLLKTSFIFTGLSWGTASVVLGLYNLLFLRFNIIYPNEGIVYLLNVPASLIIFLVIAWIYNFTLMLLPVIFNFLVKKKWEALVGALVTELLLPIFLFNLTPISEEWLPINLLNNLLIVQKNQAWELVYTLIFLGICLVIELFLIVFLNHLIGKRGTK